MKKSHFPAALKTWATAIFCALFAFTTSVSAQNATAKKLQQIKEFRAQCTELLKAFPEVHKIESAKFFSASEKQKLVSAIETLEKASQIEDNASDAVFSSLKNKFEGVRDWLANLELKGVGSAAKANNSPNSNSPFDQCVDGCDDDLAFAKSNCSLLGKLGATRKEVSDCKAKAIVNKIFCVANCSAQ